MSVIADVVGLEVEFVYFVPESWQADGRADRLAVGSMVRVSLGNRRVNGWVSELGVEAPAGVKLQPLIKLRGMGPSAEVMKLASWAGWRWAGSRVKFLRAASPERNVVELPAAVPRPVVPSGPTDVFSKTFEIATERGLAVVRNPPKSADLPLALEACRKGDALLVCATNQRARQLAVALGRAGIKVAFRKEHWALAASGATVVGTRSAAWMPMPSLAAVVVFDEHDELHISQESPTWNAREVAVERGRRRGVPVVLSSPIPSLEALMAGPLLKPNRAYELNSWPQVKVIDRRDEDPMHSGLFAPGLSGELAGTGRVVCVLNRKGRSRLMSCAACGELVRTSDKSAPMFLNNSELVSPDGSEIRPQVCVGCGSTVLKNLRKGIKRAREDLAALAGEPVDEVSAATKDEPTSRIVIGTEAVLHRIGEAETVIFLDLDQELLVPRQRALEQAMALLVKAARMVGQKDGGGRLVLQTRMPDHEVVWAAMAGDPSIVASKERDRRKAVGIPPYGAQVLVSGGDAAVFVESLPEAAGLRIAGPLQGRYLLQAKSRELILDALAEVPRPDSRRVRIEVDPQRE